MTTDYFNAILVVNEQKTNARSNNNAFKKKYDEKNDGKVCIHCKSIGHSRDICFKLHRYLEQFKEKKNNEKVVVATMSHSNETPLDLMKLRNDKLSNILQMQHEILKYIKKQHSVSSVNEVGWVAFNDFVGFETVHYSNNYKINDEGTWVIDRGTATHMCYNFSLLIKPTN